jgi:8-oxo-dGTP pyrophosphatase MutT (NUDIX family)
MGNSCPGCGEKERPGALVVPSSTATPSIHNNDKADEFSSVSIPLGRSISHILTLAQCYAVHFEQNVMVDYSDTDYRAFCLLFHRQYGALLLYCTRKKRKPPHYQLPGGHVDAAEFRQVSKNGSRFVTQEQLYLSARLGCIREIYEETGIDLRKQVDRLRPMVLYDKPERGRLINELKHRLFYVCEVQDDDFVAATMVRKIRAAHNSVRINGYA